MQTRLLFVHALSPLHAGTGQSVGAVDLAIARDRATEHPYLPGSSIKGTLRARSEALLGREKTIPVFGPDTDRASDHAGALIVGDANLLLLPVRSLSGTFAWATSKLLLAKYARDAKEAGVTLPKGDLPAANAVESCQVTTNSAVSVRTKGEKKVIFEDLDFTPAESKALDAWADHLGNLLFPGDEPWRQLLRERLCVVHDDVMSFLSRHGTDVVMRIKLHDDKKTVDGGALWSEESLPVETVLVSLVGAQPIKGTTPQAALEALNALTAGAVQLGGKATVGRGRCRLVVGGGR